MFLMIFLFFLVDSSRGFISLPSKHNGFNIFDSSQIDRYRSKLYMAQHQPLDGESVVQSLHHFRKVYDHVDIPLTFVVPNNSSWPDNLHGFRLGTVLRRIKYKGVLPEYHEQLEDLGFIINTLDHKFELFLRSLKRYKELNADSMKVPPDYQIPRSSLWPEDTWGLRLGSKVISTRAGRIHKSAECIAKLNELHFIWDPASNAASLFLTTLKHFKEENGHVNVPKNYMIPYGNTIYPKEAWGMKIGLKITNFIYRGDYSAYKDKLVEIGLGTMKMRIDTRHWEFIYQGMKMYKSIYGHLRVRVHDNWLIIFCAIISYCSICITIPPLFSSYPLLHHHLRYLFLCVYPRKTSMKAYLGYNAIF